MSSDLELDVEVFTLTVTRDGSRQSWAFGWSSRPSTDESIHHLVCLGPQPEPGEPLPIGPITASHSPSTATTPTAADADLTEESS